mgnify:FL=1
MPKRKPTKTFHTYIERTEVSRVKLSVQAANAHEAKRLALREIEAKAVPLKPEDWKSQSVCYTCPFVDDQTAPIIRLPAWGDPAT